jgi:hypothetical protein
VLVRSLLSYALAGCVCTHPSDALPQVARTTSPCEPGAEAIRRVAELRREGARDDDGSTIGCAVPGAPESGTASYCTAVLLERANREDDAIAAYEAVRRAFPRGPDARRATRRVGRLYAREGRLALAADRLEDYADRYAAERDSVEALEDAIAFRAALGDDTRRAADSRMFFRMYRFPQLWLAERPQLRCLVDGVSLP